VLGYDSKMTADDLGALYSREELEQMFASVGDDVAVNRSVIFYSPKNISLGSNVRIDCFGLISAGTEGIEIGDHVHISSYCCLVGAGGKILLESFTGVASRSTLYTATDDFSEGYMTGPTIPDRYRKVRTGGVTMRKHSVIGCGTVVLPEVTIGLAATVGALSLVKASVPEFAIAVGNPLRVIGQRDRRILDFEKEFLAEKALNRHRPGGG
jgi:dTDP-4-amino-4,6-dideoxy-D-glucose acyltransferase